jgi:hypothetical protein
MNSVSSGKTTASRDVSCLSVGVIVSNWQSFMVKKIPEMHIVFVALLEDPTECFPSTYNFRREPGILLKRPFSCAMKGCCKAFITPQNMTAFFA